MVIHIIKTYLGPFEIDKSVPQLLSKELADERLRKAEQLRQSRIKDLIDFLDKKHPWDCYSMPYKG